MVKLHKFLHMRLSPISGTPSQRNKAQSIIWPTLDSGMQTLKQELRHCDITQVLPTPRLSPVCNVPVDQSPLSIHNSHFEDARLMDRVKGTQSSLFIPPVFCALYHEGGSTPVGSQRSGAYLQPVLLASWSGDVRLGKNSWPWVWLSQAL